MDVASRSTQDSGRVILVTGSVRGLGLGVARAFARQGERVHVVARSSVERARALEDEFAGRVHRADVADEQGCEGLVREVLALDGRLDVLVHAVGEYASGPLEGIAPDDFRRMFTSNTESAFLMLRASRAELRRAGGCAVFFGCAGLHGHRGRVDTAAYSAAKSALFVLVRSAAREEAPHGVRVNMVSPGLVPHDAAADDTLDARLQAQIPLGRPGRLDDVSAAVTWLASDAAGYVTGSNLEVTGGWWI